MRLSYLPIFTAVFIAIVANQTTLGQAQTSDITSTPTTTQSSPGVSTQPKLLGDFVPCVQDPSEEWDLRGLEQPTPLQNQPLGQDQANTAMDSVVAAGGVNDTLKAAISSKLNSNKDQYAQLTPKAATAKIASDAIAATTSSTASASDKTAAISAIKSVSTPSTPTYQRPNDVSCSISILGWNETSDTFGRRIANDYVALQVTVRNLNSKNEFLIHDVQVAVDTGVVPAYFGQFHGGRDKLLIRAVAQRGQFEDRRNLIINSLGLVGAVAAVPGANASGEFSTAVAVFTGQLVPGLANVVFPDHTVQQINNINDLGFSASSTSKMIVPVQGSVPFVTFIAERPIEQLPFAWCGSKKQKDKSNPQLCNVPQLGKTGGIADWNTSTPVPSLSYKKWSGAALRILQNNTYVVVGGMHITEENNSASISNLNCPAIFGGPVDLSQVTNGQFACMVTGSALSSVHSVQLELNSDKVSGTIKPSTDGTSAQILFTPTDLASRTGSYELYFVDASGNATDAQNSMQLSEQPFISTLSPNTGTTPQSITLAGTSLTKLGTVSLVPSTSGNAVPCTPPGTNTNTDSSWTCQASSTLASGSYYLQYTISNIPSFTAIRKDLTFTVK